MANILPIEQMAEMSRTLTQARIENWLGHEFGSWRWWVLLALLVLPWFVWYKSADRKRLPEIVLFGLVVMVFTITLDELGFELSLWSYPVDVIPIFPRLTSVDYSVVPVVFMLIYQFFPDWKGFFQALVAVAAVFSFVVEPVIVKLGFYVLIKWTYWASFIIYIPMGLLARWITRQFADAERRARG